MADEVEIRNSFLEQAQWCQKLGSPFTALLCETLARNLDAGTAIGREILGWPGNPRAMSDALALRVAGALHALARGDRAPALTAVYPPAALPSPDALWRACRDAFAEHEAHFRGYLAVAPQTNEVARSGVLITGFLLFAQHFGVPVHLYEIGASAGLNLIPDRYRYRFGDSSWGDARALLELAPSWQGSEPPVRAGFRVITRQGCDLAPIDVTSMPERSRLLSYVWADQFDRGLRLMRAIDCALVEPARVEAVDAAEWVEQRLPALTAGDGGRVLFHSVFWHYLPAGTQRRIEARVNACGAAATAARPFGWLRFELDPAGGPATLLLTRWPGGESQLIARADPHGRSVTYLL